MDKELAQLEEWAVNLINDYEETLRQKGVTPSGPGGSEFKRIGRFSGELVANPEAYGELLDMARSKNMSGKQLVQAIRTIEDLILGQKQSVRDPVLRNMIESMSWNPTDRRKLMSDVIHHLYAQRTGGDTLRRLSQPERAATRSAIRDVYGRWGNIDENLLSLFRSWHTKQEKAKGAEAAAIERLGGDPSKAGLQGTELIHTLPASSKKISGTVLGETAEEVLPGMLSQFEEQRLATEATLKQVQPAVDALDNIVAQYLPEGTSIKYALNLSNEDLKLYNKILSEHLGEVEDVFAQNLSPFYVDAGKVNYNAAFGSIPQAEQLLKIIRNNAPEEAVGALFGFMLDPEMRQAVEEGDAQRVGSVALRDVGLSAAANVGAQEVVKRLPQQIVQQAAPILKTAGTVSNVATPIAAVSQIEGSVDPVVTQRKAVERLAQGNQPDVTRKQYLPQEYGAAGPQLDPTTGKVITEPKPLIGMEQVQQALNFFGGVVKMMPTVGFF